MTTLPEIDATLVAAQNDQLRKALCLGETNYPIVPGRLVWTASIAAREGDFFNKVRKAIGEFETFEPENDPDEFHDFGAVEVEGETVWFKIDHYDADYKYGSEDPSDLKRTRRVLTILLPSDW